MKVIIYPTENGVSVLTVAPEYEDQLYAVAGKDIPKGKVWRVIESEDLPKLENGGEWQWTETGPLAIKPQEPIAPTDQSEGV